MEENNLNSNNQIGTNNSIQEQNEPNKGSNKILIAILLLIIVVVCGYLVYTKFIQKADINVSKDNNKEEQNIVSSGNDESNEGTIESCKGCKFIYSTKMLYTTWNKAGGEGNNPTEPLTPSVFRDYTIIIKN